MNKSAALPTQLDLRTLLADLFILGLVALLLIALVSTAQRWTASLIPAVEIHASLHYLPLYALFSLSRAVIAYLLSLTFAIGVGYFAAKNKFAERLLLPLVAVGQSIPSMAIFAVMLLGLVALFPLHNVGLELASILLIFLSQTWDMTLSFYSSLKSIPPSFYELSVLSGMSRVQTLYKIEMPAAATGLAWNSMVSMAGGWFFLSAVESYSIGDQTFRVPGLRSFMSLAVEQNNYRAQFAALITMLGIILFIDFVVWRPIIALTRKFSMDEELGTEVALPLVSRLIRDSRFTKYAFCFARSASQAIERLNWKYVRKKSHAVALRLLPSTAGPSSREMLLGPFIFIVVVLIAFVLRHFYLLLKPVVLTDYILIVKAAGATSLRVLASVTVATLWTIPVGIGIGLNSKLTRIMQPIIQIAASFPAPMLFPIAIAFMTKFGAGPGLQASALILLSIQWYVLFNVLAGAVGMSQVIRENYRLMKVTQLDKWKQLYLPSIFPWLVTGLMTATGRAWNASIVAEYFTFHERTLTAFGLGSLLRQAVSKGNFSLFTACVLVLITIALATNQLLWKRILHKAQTKYRFER